MGTFIDLHILQTLPPSNVNRDDTGSPKTAFYGGVRRARVSSQAWKRATRQAFTDVLSTDDLGVRTKRLLHLLADEIQSQQGGVPGDENTRTEALAIAKNLVGAAFGLTKFDKPRAKKGEEAIDETEQAQYLIFVGNRQISALAAVGVAAAAAGSAIDKKEAKRAADTHHSVDVALFGRMVADATELNVDASVQVAHAISVHGVENEFDYFTAVDDKAPEDNAGAGMIGTVEFNSSTLYRYATINVDRLHETLQDADIAERAVAAFARAFVTSMPTGKQNTFANRTLPDGVVAVVRTDQPINWAGAFEEAVTATGDRGRLARATEVLTQHHGQLQQAYGDKVSGAYVVQVGEATAALSALGRAGNLDDLVAGISEATRAAAASA